MRLIALLLTITCAGTAPAPALSTKPASQPANSVAAKARLEAALASAVTAQNKLDACRSAAGAQFDASAQGKTLAADVKAKQAAESSARARGDKTNATRLASEAYRANEAFETARNTAIKDTPEVAAAFQDVLAVSAETRRIKQEYYAILRAEKEQTPAGKAEAEAKRRSEIDEAIRNGTFLKGMNEAEADQASKVWDLKAAPLRRDVTNGTDGTRTIRYVISTSRQAYRWVTLTLKDGLVINIDNLEKLNPD